MDGEVVVAVVVALNLGLPMLLSDVVHLHVLAKLGQAVMANCTCCS